MASLTIPRRFNGPRHSGNGGYCTGAIAAFLDGPAVVSLRRPVPLEVALEVHRSDDGRARVVHGEALVAEAAPAGALELELPAPVTPADAAAARERYAGLAGGEFSHCFVCGRDRPDALGVFAGAVDGGPVAASSWRPPGWTAGAGGAVRPEIVSAVLDCPTYFAAYGGEEGTPAFLVALQVRLDAPVRAGADHVVVGWPLEAEGRKRHAASAILAADGTPVACARALMVEPRRPGQ